MSLRLSLILFVIFCFVLLNIIQASILKKRQHFQICFFFPSQIGMFQNFSDTSKKFGEWMDISSDTLKMHPYAQQETKAE